MQALGSFERLTATVRAAMSEALTRILTPTRRVDVLADIAAAKVTRDTHEIHARYGAWTSSPTSPLPRSCEIHARYTRDAREIRRVDVLADIAAAKVT